MVAFGCVCALTNKPALRSSEEMWCAGSFLSVNIEEPAKRSVNDRPARSTPYGKVRLKGRHERRAGCSSGKAVSWASNTDPRYCIPSHTYVRICREEHVTELYAISLNQEEFPHRIVTLRAAQLGHLNQKYFNDISPTV